MDARIVCPHGHNCTTEIEDTIPWQVGLTNQGSPRPWCWVLALNSDQWQTSMSSQPLIVCIEKPTNSFNLSSLIMIGPIILRQLYFKVTSCRLSGIQDLADRPLSTMILHYILRLKAPVDWAKNSKVRPSCMMPPMQCIST